jgi:hypothetical protein
MGLKRVIAKKECGLNATLVVPTSHLQTLWESKIL